MRLLFVLPDADRGGAQRVAVTLANALAAMEGVEVRLALFSADVGSASIDPEIDVVAFGSPRLRSSFARLFSEIRRTRPDVVFSTLGYINTPLSVARAVLPKRTALVFREANLPSIALDAAHGAGAYRWIYRRFYPLADAVIASSERMADEFRRDFGLPRERLRVLPNPVDVDAIRAAVRGAERDPNDGVRFVSCGRLERQKGLDRIIGSFASLGESVVWDIVGEGSQRSALEAQARAAGLGARVRFHGRLSEPWSLISEADAMLMPSRFEGMPNAALEALACGVPVIATPESGGVEELAEQAQGWVEVAAVGQAFDAAMARTRRRSRHGTDAASALPDRYESASVAQSFLATLNEVVDRRRCLFPNAFA